MDSTSKGDSTYYPDRDVG